MTDLQKFTVAAILEMARTISQELDDSTASLDQLVSSLAAFKFRDTSASYWAVGPRSLQWHRHDGGQWRPASQPSGSLEGLEILNGWIIVKRHRQPLELPTRQELQVSTAPAFLQAMLQETRQDYDQGEVSSTTAEASLAGFYLLDDNGRFWTPGFHTGSWYSFEAGRWNRAQQAPAPETLLDLQQPAAQDCANCGAELGAGDKFCRNCGNPAPLRDVEISGSIGQAVEEFLSVGLDSLPEPVTDPWDPPPDFPEPIYQCRVCATPDVGDYTHCRVCRSPLAPPSSSAVAPPQISRPAAPLSPPARGQSSAAYPGSTAPRGRPQGAAPHRQPPRRSRSFFWLWILLGGYLLVFLCSACVLLLLWQASSQGIIGF